jgi:mono/diheme cytochrome c family protein
MTRLRPAEALLGLLLLLGLLVHLGIGPDHRVRNVEFLPEMVVTAAYDALDPNPNFADGATLRVPPEDTIPRGFAPLLHDGVPLDLVTPWADLAPPARAAWEALRPPRDPDTLAEPERLRLLARGREVFSNTCAACHGAGAAGDAPVTARGVPPPPTLLRPESRAMSDGQMFRVVTAGQANMPAHANLITRNDRWSAILYVRRLQAPGP